MVLEDVTEYERTPGGETKTTKLAQTLLNGNNICMVCAFLFWRVLLPHAVLYSLYQGPMVHQRSPIFAHVHNALFFSCRNDSTHATLSVMNSQTLSGFKIILNPDLHRTGMAPINYNRQRPSVSSRRKGFTMFWRRTNIVVRFLICMSPLGCFRRISTR